MTTTSSCHRFRHHPARSCNLAASRTVEEQRDDHGVDEACLSVIGQLGESRGVLISASLDDFEAFVAAAESVRSRRAPAGWR